MITAKVHLDSINDHGDRLTTFVCYVPKQLLQELNTHRVFSRNAASSRAVPIDRVVQQVIDKPFIPPVWEAENKGKMYAEAEIEHPDYATAAWLNARDSAVHWARVLQKEGVHRQWVNALLEPFVMVPWIVSSTTWDNCLKLRLRGDARITFRILARQIKDGLMESTPTYRQPGDWHVPFDSIDGQHRLEVAVAKIARVSYGNHDKSYDIEKDVQLHDTLRESGHWSPFEHVAMSDEGPHRNFRGWKQLREFYEV